MKKGLTLTTVALLGAASLAMAATSSMITVNVKAIKSASTVSMISAKYNYATCSSLADCTQNSNQFNGFPMAHVSGILPMFQNMEISTTADAEKLFGKPYVDFGIYQNGNTTWPTSCELPMTKSANYIVLINQTGCVLQSVQ